MSSIVLIIGSSRFESLESSYARAFQHSGWNVQFWDPVRALHKVSYGYRFGRLFSTFVHVEPWLRKANLDLLKLADKISPNLILVIGTTGVRGGTLAQIRVRAPKTLIYCIYPDTPHNLDAERIHCLPFFDRVATSSPAWTKAFECFGATRVHYLPFAADPDLHHPVMPDNARNSLTHDVVFIGNWRHERELFLEQLADFDLWLWGENYWKYRTRPGSPLRARWGGRALTGAESARACAESKILLNFMDLATWPGPNMRSFEQPACRAFVLVNRTQALTELFKEGETIECFDSVEEARDKISYYLAHEESRQRIAQASYRFVIEGGHTYVDRVRQLQDWIQEDGLN